MSQVWALRQLKSALVITLLTAMTACTQGQDSATTQASPDRGSDFPPARALFASLGPVDSGIHARAVELALEESNEGADFTWQGADQGTRGGITVLDSYVYGVSLFCRVLEDRLEKDAVSETANDAACWNGAEWVWLRDSDDPPAVLAPLAGLPIYRTQSAGRLSDVARETGADLSLIGRLNPRMANQQLQPGVAVTLPTKAVSRPVDSGRVYVIKRGGTLEDVARVTGADLDDLIYLNPTFTGKLPKGAQVRLP